MSNDSKKKKVSIIIPIYNCEQYIEECISSVLEQKYDDYEVILIDDGSTDASGLICDKYSERFKHISTIHTENNGVSHARNVGITKATGDYIIFVDADDKTADNAIDYYVTDIGDCDLLIANYYVSHMNESKLINIENIVEYKQLNNKDFLAAYFLSSFGFQGYLWNKLFKRNIIEENRIRFNEEFKFAEDQLFIIEYLTKCNNVKLSNKYTYIYNRNENSVTEQIKRYKKDIIPDRMEMYHIVDPIISESFDEVYGAFCYSALSRAIATYKNNPNRLSYMEMTKYFCSVVKCKNRYININLKLKATIKYLFRIAYIGH